MVDNYRALGRGVVLAVGLVCAATRAQAQSPDPVATARLHFGAVALTPSVSLINVGMDSNVFNATNDASPKRDFTATLQPKVNLWMHIGPSIASGTVEQDLVYYKTYASERTVNGSYRAGWLIPLNRLKLDGAMTYLKTRDRPGFEIDARSLRYELGYNGSVEFRAYPKTSFTATASHMNVDFHRDAVFLGASLHDELNRGETRGGASVRYALTPLTSVTLGVERRADRFQHSPLRDSDSTETRIGVQFDPFGILKGSAMFGVRSFRPREAGVAGFTGVTGTADLSYVGFAITKISVQAQRDVQYSFAVDQPYYVLTGATLSLWRQLYGQIDGVGRAGRQQLAYRDRVGAVLEVSNRTDYVNSFGGGLSYRLGRDVRLSVNIDWVRRSSSAQGHSYNDVKIGTALTYGQ